MVKEVKEYDDNGNLIYYKDINGYEYWREYDSENRVIHFKDHEEEYFWEYNDTGKLIKKISITTQIEKFD